MTQLRPLRAVLNSFQEGCSTVTEIETHTGLSAEVVAAAIDHLVRMGEISATQLNVGCPDGGCRSCASGLKDVQGARPGCGAAGPSTSRQGPVLVALTVGRPRPEVVG